MFEWAVIVAIDDLLAVVRTQLSRDKSSSSQCVSLSTHGQCATGGQSVRGPQYTWPAASRSHALALAAGRSSSRCLDLWCGFLSAVGLNGSTSDYCISLRNLLYLESGNLLKNISKTWQALSSGFTSILTGFYRYTFARGALCSRATYRGSGRPFVATSVCSPLPWPERQNHVQPHIHVGLLYAYPHRSQYDCYHRRHRSTAADLPLSLRAYGEQGAVQDQRCQQSLARAHVGYLIHQVWEWDLQWRGDWWITVLESHSTMSQYRC